MLDREAFLVHTFRFAYDKMGPNVMVPEELNPIPGTEDGMRYRQ